MKQWRHEGQRIAIPVRAAMICRRTSGSVGRGGGPRPVGPSARFFPEPPLLQEREGHHRQQGMMVQRSSTSALEMVEPELFLELLVRLLANPSSATRSIRLRRSGRLQPAEGAP
jgi:hypothetical protein